MAIRRVYRGIEEAALLGGFPRLNCPHNIVARRLRYDYREIRDVMNRDLAYAVAVASIYGNKSLSARTGWDSMQSAFERSLNGLPYFSSKPMSSIQDKMIQIYKKLEEIPKEAWKKEFDRHANSEGEELHVLGGKPSRGAEI